MDREPRRQSLLVLRVDFEAGSAAPVRIHLRSARDVGRGYDHEAHFADVEAACQATRAWLDAVVPPAWAASDY